MGDQGNQHSLLEVLLSAIDVSRKLGDACAGRFPRSVEVLIGMVESNLSTPSQYKIVFHPRNYQSNTFIGTIEAFQNEAHIYYDLNRSKCWRRFIVAKEMCHLLFATYGEKHLASTPEQIEQLISTIMAGLERVDFKNDHKASTEGCTVFMALEVLLPHNERQNVRKKVEAGASVLDVAKDYLIPAQMVNLYLSADYVRMMERFLPNVPVPP